MATKNPSVEVVVAGRAHHGSQSWRWASVFKLRGSVLRVEIERDSYNAQSFLSVQTFDPTALCWHPFIRRPIQGSASESVTYGQKDAPLAAFRADEADLLREADAILSAAGKEA